MKTISIQQATLEECVECAQAQRIVLTRRGKPVALVVGVAGLDLEQIQLGLTDEFWALIRERRGQKTISRAKLEKRLDKQQKSSRRVRANPNRSSSQNTSRKRTAKAP